MSLFKRVETTVTMADGRRKRSWMYVSNRSLDAVRRPEMVTGTTGAA